MKTDEESESPSSEYASAQKNHPECAIVPTTEPREDAADAVAKTRVGVPAEKGATPFSMKNDEESDSSPSNKHSCTTSALDSAPPFFCVAWSSIHQSIIV